MTLERNMETRKSHPKSDLNVILWFIKPYLGRAMLLFVILFAYALFDTISVGALYPFINKILSGASGTVQYSGRILSMLEEISVKIPINDKLIAASVFLLFLVVVTHVAGIIAETLSLWYHLILYTDLQNRVYNRIIRNTYSYFHVKKQGELMYIGREASLSVGEIFFYFPKTGIEVFRVIVITALLVSISIKYTAIAYAVIAVFGLFVYFLSNRIVSPAAQKAQTVYANITSIFSETIAGIRQIKIADAYRYWLGKFSKETETAKRLQFRYVAPSYFPSHLIIGVGSMMVISSIIYLKMRMPDKFGLLFPIVIVYMGALTKLMPSLSNISQQWMGLKGLFPRLRITYETLSDRQYIEDDGTKDFIGFERDIRFDNVGFSYATRDGVLKDVSIIIPKNKVVAIVGESGSGKSTIADIFLRLYAPTQGSISVDGEDYLAFSRSSWLKHVGMVSQDAFIFHASIKDNIAMGKPDANAQEIDEAARMAFADRFIQDLPDKYNTILGERGVKISGGQRQRIAIARALIGQPEILIFDEATSSLDNISERKVQEAILQERANKTTIIIAHRLSTIEHADKIIVINRGKVVEEGKHEELLSHKGHYHDLYYRQKRVQRKEVI